MVPVEVIVGLQRRCRWSAAEKKAMLQEAEQPGMSMFQSLKNPPI
jgi:hypothetical protein